MVPWKIQGTSNLAGWAWQAEGVVAGEVAAASNGRGATRGKIEGWNWNDPEVFTKKKQKCEMVILNWISKLGVSKTWLVSCRFDRFNFNGIKWRIPLVDQSTTSRRKEAWLICFFPLMSPCVLTNRGNFSWWILRLIVDEHFEGLISVCFVPRWGTFFSPGVHV